MALDDESKAELIDAFQELYDETEHCLTKLQQGHDTETLNQLFRAIHNIKGNAGIMQLNSIVEFTHEIEEVAGALRRQQFTVSPPLAEAMLIAMDRLHDLHHQELFGKRFEHLRIEELKTLYQALAKAGAEEAEFAARQILEFLGAGLVNTEIDLFSVPKKSVATHCSTEELPRSTAIADLIFFHEMATQLDKQMPDWNGRSEQLFDWAMKMNVIAGCPVNKQQFAAAICLHDFGMSLMARELWHKKLDLNPEELEALQRHPQWGYEFLVRIPNWQEAATIVLQHHEAVDGSGYPNGLTGEQIHAGAKILAILDTFFFLTQGKVDSSVRKSTVRAVSAINARIDTKFEGLWVQCFNHMIRKELHSGAI